MSINKHDFFDIYYQPGENPVFCYRTGLTVYEEALVGGAFVSQGWNGAGYPLNVLTNFSTRLDPYPFGEPFAFNLDVNGASTDYGLRFIDFTTERTETSLHGIITLESGNAPVRIKVHTILDGTAMFTRWLEVENLSETSLNISRMNPLAGGMEAIERSTMTDSNAIETFYSFGYFDDDTARREGDFSWHPLSTDTTAVDTRFGRVRFRHPLMFLRNNLTGSLWFAQIAYSGGCRFTVDYDAKREREHSCLSFKAEITGYHPLVVLRPGETFATPEVHMGLVQGDLDMAVNEMHAHARKSVFTLPESDASACYVGAGMGPEHDMSVATSKAFIDQMSEMGAEIFIVDAGWQNAPDEEDRWFCCNGLNRPDTGRYPNGIKELSDYCHAKGMKFGMWVEIERIGEDTGLREAHPDWFAVNVFGEKNGRGFIDFTNPEAAKWAEDELARIIEECGLELLRVDYNVNFLDYHGVKRFDDGRREYNAVRHMNAVNEMYIRLKKRFPSVIFENCAAGGGRTDWAQMKGFNHTWVSDCQALPRSALITNGMTMALPPERVDRLFAGMGCHQYGSIDAHMRNTMLGHMTLNVVAPAATYPNPLQMAFIKHSVRLYKDFIRPFLPTCKVFHPTPDVKEAARRGYTLLEIAAEDGSRGVLGAFTLLHGGDAPMQVTLKGVDAGKQYRVTLDNSGESFVMSGAALMMNGLTLRIPAALASELVIYEAL